MSNAKLDELRSHLAIAKEARRVEERFEGNDEELARTLLVEKHDTEEQKLSNGSPRPTLPNAERK